MSEEDTTSTSSTSNTDSTAVATVAASDDTSSSFASNVTSNSDGTTVSGGSISSSDDSSSVNSAAVESTYSSAALSSLDQTYYNGALTRAAVVTTTASQAPTKSTYTVVASSALNITDSAQLSQTVWATSSGQAILYKNETAAVNPNGWAFIGEWSGGAGAAIYFQKSGMSVGTGGELVVGKRAQFWLGSDGQSAANLTLAYKTSTMPGLYMSSGTYLSATGYIGGVADKSNAGTNLGAGNANSRTGTLNLQEDVGMDIGGDWGTIGDYSNGAFPVNTTVGNNNRISAGGNVGVFLNASVNAGNNLSLTAGTSGSLKGSGLFVGSGALWSGGTDGTYLVYGGMGAAYANKTTGATARLVLGDNNSVTLNNANWGNFAAQNGGSIIAGNDFYLRALELSVGYGQNTSNGAILSPNDVAASMTIGNNAVISLAQSGLADNGYNFYLGNNGAITVDGANATLTVGTGALITANTISIGNYAKDYSGVNPNTSSAMNFAYFTATSNGVVTIGSGANINLSGGIAVDGNNETLTLLGGGTTGNILSAGGISMGAFAKQYKTAVSGSNFIFNRGTGGTITIGDNYNITLTSGVVATGITNSSAISNTGNITNTALGGKIALGNAVTLTANSVYVGDYLYSKYNSITSAWNVSSAFTSSASMTFGTNATVNLSGGILLNGQYNSMTYGNYLTMHASTISLGSGITGATTPSISNVFSVGTNGNITISNGFTDNQSQGTVAFGDNTNLTLVAGNLVIGGSGTATKRNTFTMGAGNALTLSTGSIVISNTSQTFAIGSAGTIKAADLIVSGTNQIVSAGNNATVALTGGVTVSATATSMTFGDSTNMTVGASGINFLTSTNFTLGAGGSLAVSGNITFAAGTTGTVFTVGSNTTLLSANSIVINGSSPVITLGTGINYNVSNWNLNTANLSIGLGNGATGSIGNIVTVSSGAQFNTGSATNLSFGSAGLVSNALLTLNGIVSGQTINLSNTANVVVSAGANVSVASLVMDGTAQVVVSVGAGATFDIGAISTTNVGTANIPKIINYGGTINVGSSTVTQSTFRTLAATNASTPNYAVDFSDANGIVNYKGTIESESGNFAIQNFHLTNELTFAIEQQYTDASRYVTSYANGILTITYINTDGSSTVLGQFSYTPADTTQAVPNVVITEDASLSTGWKITITKCFLTGTHISTPSGEVVVEQLKVGDLVTTLEGGTLTNKKIVWVGMMDVNVNNYEHKEALYPVRIKAHAFGLNQPCRDLLVTPEHTIYVDGGLIPARMLVNGRSVIVDKTQDRFSVYHIETEAHSILLSENLTTESYLNTDDRHLFNGDVVNLHLTFDENAGHQSWERDAAAPLTVARGQVEPIWQRLDRRATQQGYAPLAKPSFTNDPELCLITEKGSRLQPIDIKGNIYSFYVPANVSVVALHSKAGVPSKVIGPFLDDRRMLGVLVAKITVIGNRTLDILPADMASLSGWHPAELNRTDRWTKGLAILPESVSEVSNRVKLIKVELTATADYLLDEVISEDKIA